MHWVFMHMQQVEWDKGIRIAETLLVAGVVAVLASGCCSLLEDPPIQVAPQRTQALTPDLIEEITSDDVGRVRVTLTLCNPGNHSIPVWIDLTIFCDTYGLVHAIPAGPNRTFHLAPGTHIVECEYIVFPAIPASCPRVYLCNMLLAYWLLDGPPDRQPADPE
jgi:hypothetical protein